jgi:proteasome alpha subunit
LSYSIILNFLRLGIITNNRNYDKSTILFSPEGELLQVDYAEKASQLGSTVLCTILNSSHVLIVCSPCYEPTDIFLDKKNVGVIKKIDDDIYAVVSGLKGDSIALIKKARQFCLNFRQEYGCCPFVESVVKHIADFQHMCTMRGGNFAHLNFFIYLPV